LRDIKAIRRIAIVALAASYVASGYLETGMVPPGAVLASEL